MKRKLLTNGGNSMCEALKNLSNKFDAIPTKDNCLYVISDSRPDVLENDESNNANKDEYEKFLFTDYKQLPGGIIIFSTDINSKELAAGKFKNYILQKFKTYRNRFSVLKILDKFRKKNNIYAWTVGRYFRGEYTGNDGKTYSENSLTIECIGIDRKTLFTLAEDICKEFDQESVLVKDNSTNQIYFVSA